MYTVQYSTVRVQYHTKFVEQMLSIVKQSIGQDVSSFVGTHFYFVMQENFLKKDHSLSTPSPSVKPMPSIRLGLYCI